MTLLGPPDTEPAIVTVLAAGMESATVATKVSNPRPSGTYVRVTSLGGSNRNLVQVDPRSLIECWGDTETDAFNAAQLAWALLWAAQDTYLNDDVYATRIVSTTPVNFPDPDTNSPRYQFITTITASLVSIVAP